MSQQSGKAKSMALNGKKHIRNPRRIAVFRALQLGDLLLAIPALRAIRRQFPQAEITLIGLPWATTFASRFRCYIDRFVDFAGYPGIDEVEVVPQRTKQFLAEQHAYHYDLVIQMHGNGQTSNSCVLDMGGRITAGYYPEHLHQPVALMLGAPYPDHVHEIERNLGLARLLGCQHLDTKLDFPLFNEDYAEAAQLLSALPGANRPWIGIHAGARPPARRWPPEYFAQVADTLSTRFEAQVILTGGHSERTTVQTVAHAMKSPYLNLAGKTSLGGLAALIGELDLFISNDTGPAHIANAVDTPGITIFGPVDPARWAALDQKRHPFVRRPVACSPCGYWKCPIDHRCLRWLAPEMVIETASYLLADRSLAERC